MASQLKSPLITIDEYLRAERTAEERHEFLDGQVFAMAGESGAHADISANVVGTLGNQLKGTRCRVRSKGTQVRSGPSRPYSKTRGLYSYPDVLVICGEPVYHDEHQDVILNPTVVIEVLSPTTEAFDRGAKFERMRNWNPTLENYVLVSQHRPLIEVFQRGAGTSWSLQPLAGLEAIASLAAIECVLRLGDVYDRVEFPPSEDP